MSTGYDAFLLYQAVKLHFTSESYDFFKYRGKYRCSVETFERRQDRYFFHKLCRKYPTTEELTFFLASTFFLRKPTWVRESLTEEAHDHYLYRKRNKESLGYLVKQDLDKLGIDHPKMKALLQVTQGDPPMLLQAAWHGDIHDETLIVLNTIIEFLPVWSGKIEDTIVFPDYRRHCERYAPFLDIDKKKFQTLLRARLTETK